MDRVPFIVAIQREGAEFLETNTYRHVLNNYVSFIVADVECAGAGSTLSNCRDTPTECTCDFDDCGSAQ